MPSTARIGARALSGLLPDLQAQSGPLYAALRDAVTALVRDGRVAPETRLPSERDLAAALHVSRATVTAAYDALRESGYLASRTGAGSFVTVPAGRTPRASIALWGDAEGADPIDLSCAALPAPSGLLESVLPEAAASLAQHTGGDGYAPAGLPALRAAVAARFAARGVPTDPDQIMITNGAAHGIDLLLRLLSGPGDCILTELPTYPGALDAAKRAGLRVVGVPVAADGGWDVAALRNTFRQTTPRLAYLIPDFHNPTGALMDDAARAEVLRAARTSGTTVIVDESFVELGFEAPMQPAAAVDSRVITIGSLSKPIWGGLRIGWVRASPDLVHRLSALRAGTDMGGPVLDQLMGAELVARLPELMPQRTALLQNQRDALLTALARELPAWRTTVPRGGISMWLELPTPTSTALTLRASSAGVVLVPGSRFGVDGTLERFIRIPFALPPERLDEAVCRLAVVWSQLGSAPALGRPLIVA